MVRGPGGSQVPPFLRLRAPRGYQKWSEQPREPVAQRSRHALDLPPRPDRRGPTQRVGRPTPGGGARALPEANGAAVLTWPQRSPGAHHVEPPRVPLARDGSITR